MDDSSWMILFPKSLSGTGFSIQFKIEAGISSGSMLASGIFSRNLSISHLLSASAALDSLLLHLAMSVMNSLHAKAVDSWCRATRMVLHKLQTVDKPFLNITTLTTLSTYTYNCLPVNLFPEQATVNKEPSNSQADIL